MSYPESSDREGHLYSTACTLLESNHQTAHNSAQKKLLARAAQRSFLRPVPEYHPSVFEASQGGSIRFDEESKVHGRVVRNETSMSPICSRIFRIGDRTFVDAQIPVAVAGCDEWNNLYFARVFCQIKSVILWRIRIRFTQLLGTWCSWHFWSATYAVEQFNSAHADIRSTVSVVIRSGLCQVNEDPKWLIPQLISIQKWWMFPSDMCVGPICLFTSRFDVLIRRDISDVLEPVVLPSSVSCYMLKLCKRTC